MNTLPPEEQARETPTGWVRLGCLMVAVPLLPIWATYAALAGVWLGGFVGVGIDLATGEEVSFVSWPVVLQAVSLTFVPALVTVAALLVVGWLLRRLLAAAAAARDARAKQRYEALARTAERP